MGINQFNTQLDELVVGDLVAFCGYSYTPDFLIYDEERDGSLGVILHIKSTLDIAGPMYKTYTVFWFKMGTRSKEIRDHLRLLKPVRRE